MKSLASEIHKAVTKPFQSRNSLPNQAGRTAGPFQIKTAILN